MYDPYNVYRGRYKEFIYSIMKERPQNEKQDYNEYHHVIPHCVGGTDDETNLFLNLKPREHFIAHKLLAEENPENVKLVYAYWCLSTGMGHRDRGITPEEYEESRRVVTEVKRLEWSTNNPKSLDPPVGEKNPMYGRVHPNRGKTIPHDLSDEGRESIKTSMSNKSSNSRWYNNGVTEVFILIEDIPRYQSLGYTTQGRLSRGKGNPKLLGYDYGEEHRRKASITGSRLDYPKICRKCGSPFTGGKSARYCYVCKDINGMSTIK